MTIDIDQELEEEYERFIQFGQILDRRMRTYLVRYIQNKFEAGSHSIPDIDEQYFQYFVVALDNIFSIDSLLELTNNNLRLKKQIVTDIIYWFKKADKTVNKYNPWEEEKTRLESWSVTPLKAFIIRWKFLISYIGSIYTRPELDNAFYKAKFEETIGSKSYEELTQEDKDQIERLIHDILAQWDALLYAKIIQYELSKYAEEEATFTDLLSKKIIEYNKIREYVDPFSTYMGWDFSRKLWDTTSFDIINTYQELLKDERSIKELADLLGSMREAEIEIEEEAYQKTLVRQYWVPDELSKSEIVGVKQSNDLNQIVSSEVALLGDEQTEFLFLKKYADEKLSTFFYEDKKLKPSIDHVTEIHQKINQKEKGPFIICIDTSESMHGMPEQLAKVLCLGILKMAINQNRKAYLINFSTGIQTLDLYDIAESLDDIAAFLKMSFYGGTDATLALNEAINQLYTNDYKDADILVVSDFIMSMLDPDIIHKFRHHQQYNNTQFHCLTLGKSANDNVVQLFDTNWLYNPKSKGVIKALTKGFHDIATRW